MTTTRRTQRDRAQRALRLRAQRATWAEVADACGYRSRQAAQIAVRRLLDSVAPEPDVDRALSTEGLRILESRLWRQYARADAAGDTNTMIRISKEIRSLNAEGSKLNGLYRPERHEVVVTPSPREAIEQARQATLESLNQPTPQPVLDAEVVTE
ncbi:hypothetical protein [Gordonia soli]|uniref:Uncharacterized protein n=1 Tax=Gordonia soli NBRC 108243 TaxID=1223545 RepID=M0QJT6_9ACTN|nr:hypothetical protein [Gordonia soli]GAC68860.1 hypothetical protein GS4_19_00500 [Gordonia soli NBRC 108243]